MAQNADIQAKWAGWREEETSKRAAFMAYQFDSKCNYDLNYIESSLTNVTVNSRVQHYVSASRHFVSLSDTAYPTLQ